METVEYRLRWEAVDSLQAAAVEERYGGNCWPRLFPWSEFTFHDSERIASAGSDIVDQARTLRRWAETHEQPIRNVRLESRPRPNPDAGWDAVPDASPS